MSFEIEMPAEVETCALCPEPVPADPAEADWIPYAYRGTEEIGPICPGCAAGKCRSGEDGEVEVNA